MVPWALGGGACGHIGGSFGELGGSLWVPKYLWGGPCKKQLNSLCIDLTLYLPGGGEFTSPTFKLPTVLRARNFLVQNHLVNSYLCIDGVLRPFLGHFDAIPRV